MVEFTYQDYLKYEKFLQLEEQKKKEKKRMKLTEKDVDRYAKLLMKLEKILEDDYKYQESSEEETTDTLAVMEENTPYEIERNKTRRK